METTIDSAGRLLLPKCIRDALGITPGSTVDVSLHGRGVQISPGGRTARLVRNAEGRLVSHGETAVSDAAMFALMDAGRR